MVLPDGAPWSSVGPWQHSSGNIQPFYQPRQCCWILYPEHIMVLHPGSPSWFFISVLLVSVFIRDPGLSGQTDVKSQTTPTNSSLLVSDMNVLVEPQIFTLNSCWTKCYILKNTWRWNCCSDFNLFCELITTRFVRVCTFSRRHVGWGQGLTPTLVQGGAGWCNNHLALLKLFQFSQDKSVFKECPTHRKWCHYRTECVHAMILKESGQMGIRLIDWLIDWYSCCVLYSHVCCSGNFPQ